MVSRMELADESRIQARFGPSERQDRLTVFFRIILVLPHFFVLFLRGIAAEFLLIIGWICALATGRLPNRIASYVACYIQYYVRVDSYAWLMFDHYPPFSLRNREYPVDLEFHPVKLNRLAVLFRFILLIPAGIVAELVTTGIAIASFFIWVIVLIAGRMPQSLFEAESASLRFIARYMGYGFMVSSAYPGELFGDATMDRVSGTTIVPPYPDQSEARPSTPDPQAIPPESPKPWYLTDTETTPPRPQEQVGGPRYAFRDQPTASQPVEPPPPYPSRPPESALPVTPSTNHQLVMSRAGRRIVVLFLVLGVLGIAGESVTNVLVRKHQSASESLAIDYTSLAASTRHFESQTISCSADLVCLQTADRSLANAFETFRVQLQALSFPSAAQGDVGNLEINTQKFVAILQKMSTASASSYRLDALALTTAGNAIDADFQQLAVDLNG